MSCTKVLMKVMSFWLSCVRVVFACTSWYWVVLLAGSDIICSEEEFGDTNGGIRGRLRGGTLVCEADPDPSKRKVAQVWWNSVFMASYSLLLSLLDVACEEQEGGQSGL